MKKILSKVGNALFSSFSGKKGAQSFFNFFYHTGLRGMNFRNSDFSSNGELHTFKKIVNYYQSVTKDRLVVFDVGANIGVYCSLLYEVLEKNKNEFQIFCFEPLPGAFEKLVARFNHKSAVRCINYGLGKDDAIVTLYSDTSESQVASIYKNESNVGVQFTREATIQVKKLDTFCHEAIISRIHFLKVDTEGGEFDILNNAEIVREGKVDFIQFEFGTSNVDSRTYFRDFFFLLDKKYILYRILKNGLYRYDTYNYDMEIMVLGNYLAVSRDIPEFK